MEDIFKDTLEQSEIKLEILSEPNMIAALDVGLAHRPMLVFIFMSIWFDSKLFARCFADVCVEALFAGHIWFVLLAVASSQTLTLYDASSLLYSQMRSKMKSRGLRKCSTKNEMSR